MSQLLHLSIMALATQGMGPASRSLLAVPRLLSEGWNTLFGEYGPFSEGTIIPSYLYNATEPPPLTYTESNVTVGTCDAGIYDCNCLILGTECQPKSKVMPYATECANNDLKYKPTQELLWTLIVGSIMAAVMAFGIGANDSANSWATTIGSGAIRAGIGLMIGGAMEWLGAVLLGYAVSSTIQKGIAPLEDPDCWACGYCNSKMAWYNAAMVATLVGAVVLTFIATFTAMPISTTHAVVGGACGATIAATSWGCLNWSFSGLSGIVVSWVTSPLLSGIISAVSYMGILYAALKRNNPRKHALIAVVVCSFLTTFIMVFMVMLKSQYTKKLNKGLMAAAGAGGGVLVALVFLLIIVPILRKNWPSEKAEFEPQSEDVELSKSITKVEEISDENDETEGLSGHATKVGGSQYLDAVRSATNKGGKSFIKSFTEMSGRSGFINELRNSMAPDATPTDVLQYDFVDEEVREAKKAAEEMQLSVPQRDAVWSFRYLLVYQAALESFAHGANDTANATGAFMAIYNTYEHGIYDCGMTENHQWIMAVAGFFVALGVNMFGYRVIQTIGTNMTNVDYVRGWCVEFATTTAVVGATILGMPVSTTHCVVGAVIAVGLVSNGRRGVSWGLVVKIFISWVVTLPISGVVAYAFSWLFSLGVKA